MTIERDLEFERISQAWLAEGPTELADRVLAAALADVHRSHQRRFVFGVPWRFRPVSNIPRLLVAAAVIAVVGIGGLALILRPGSGPAAPSQSPPPASPSPTPISSTSPPSPRPSSIGLTTFTSPLLGYSVGLPDGWTQADVGEGLPEELYPGPDAELAERHVAAGGSPWLVVSSPLTSELPPDEWVARDSELVEERGCRPLGSEPRMVDGIAVDQAIVACSSEIVLVATVVDGDRIHQIAFGYLAGNDAANRELFRQMLATFTFTD